MGIETIAIASLGMAAAGGLVGAMGASKQADAKQAELQYKSQVAKNNAIIAERNAKAAIESGNRTQQINDMRTKGALGDTIAHESASGIDVGSGTNLSVQESIKDVGHLDSMTILYNAMKQSTGFKAQAANFTSESQLDLMGADNAKVAGEYGVASSLLGGATSFSDKWLSYSQKGII